MLDASFPPYTPGSRRLYEFEDAGEHALLTAEVDRTLSLAVGAAANRVAKGQLTAADVDRIAAAWRAIAQDLQLQEQWRAEQAAWSLADRLAWLNPDVAWAAKVAALRRELEARRTGYAGQVDKGQLTRDQAQQQLERLEAVHDLYWRQGFAFDGSREECRANINAIADADVAREKEQAA